MATKEQVRHPDRVSEIQDEISEAVDRLAEDEGAEAVLRVLEELRRQGVQRSRYNLQSPYGEGLSHRCGVSEDSSG